MDGPMTHEQGAKMLALHFVESRRSDEPGRIEALAESTDRDGTVLWEWESLPLTASALRDWLGY